MTVPGPDPQLDPDPVVPDARGRGVAPAPVDAAPAPTSLHLRGLVFVAGAATMSTEMCASRLLAPFFGSSSLVWANVIGLILVYLSVGYWWGGRRADRHPTLAALCTTTLLAAVAIAVVPFVAHPVLDAASGALDARAAGTIVGSFLGTIALFAVPVTLLGMVPPWAVRLAVRDIAGAGRTAGSLSSLSTVGSIVGTFASTLVLVPWIGTRRTMVATALLLALLSLAGLQRDLARGRLRRNVALVGAAAMLAALAVPTGLVKAGGLARGTTVLHEQESRYQYVRVLREPGGRRVLQLNEGWAVHSVYQPGEWLTGMYYDQLGAATGLVRGTAPMRVLVVGNAAGTFARLLRHYRPAAKVDGVELDPTVTAAGNRYFDMAGANLVVHEADGRPFLDHAGSRRWDFVTIDAYRQPYIPFYLATRESFREVRDHLAPGGAVAINVGGTPRDQRVVRALEATMRSVFPTVATARVGDYNWVLVATRDRRSLGQLRAQLHGDALEGTSDYGTIFDDFADGLRLDAPHAGRVLTDDHAPVEWMTDRMVVGEAVNG